VGELSNIDATSGVLEVEPVVEVGLELNAVGGSDVALLELGFPLGRIVAAKAPIAMAMLTTATNIIRTQKVRLRSPHIFESLRSLHAFSSDIWDVG